MFGHKGGKVEQELQKNITYLKSMLETLKDMKVPESEEQNRRAVAGGIKSQIDSLEKLKSLSGRIHDLIYEEL